MCAKPAWFPEAPIDVRGKLTFNGAVTAHDDNAKLQH